MNVTMVMAVRASVAFMAIVSAALDLGFRARESVWVAAASLAFAAVGCFASGLWMAGTAAAAASASAIALIVCLGRRGPAGGAPRICCLHGVGPSLALCSMLLIVSALRSFGQGRAIADWQLLGIVAAAASSVFVFLLLRKAVRIIEDGKATQAGAMACAMAGACSISIAVAIVEARFFELMLAYPVFFIAESIAAPMIVAAAFLSCSGEGSLAGREPFALLALAMLFALAVGAAFGPDGMAFAIASMLAAVLLLQAGQAKRMLAACFAAALAAGAVVCGADFGLIGDALGNAFGSLFGCGYLKPRSWGPWLRDVAFVFGMPGMIAAIACMAAIGSAAISHWANGRWICDAQPERSPMCDVAAMSALLLSFWLASGMVMGGAWRGTFGATIVALATLMLMPCLTESRSDLGLPCGDEPEARRVGPPSGSDAETDGAFALEDDGR